MLVCWALLAGAGFPASPAAQTGPLEGRWTASKPDQGVVVTLTIGASGTLVFPGVRQDGRTETLTLAIRSLVLTPQTATFSVDLPETEGALDLELRVDNESGTLRVVRIDGEPADDDVPTWTLRKVG